MNKKFIILITAATFNTTLVFSQQHQFSIATDLDFQHSFKKEQRYWAFGQTAQVQFHLTSKESIYAWFAYYSNGKFHNDLSATAKSTATNPQQINYVNNALMRYKHISVGWKHYWKGAYVSEEEWNFYSYAGFGLMLGRIENSYSVSIDTAIYNVPVRSGKTNFKRLTLDLGLGWEIPLGADVFLFNEIRVLVPTTDYPSDHIFVNKNAPLMGSLNFGIRILFD